MSKPLNQIEFNSVFFDTLFGLIIFFDIDTFLSATDPWHLAYYLFGVVIAAHWWLIFKSTDDAFGTEVTSSVADVFFGLLYIIAIAYFVNFAKNFDLKNGPIAMVFLFGVDIAWALLWKSVGKWSYKGAEHIRSMEKELKNTLISSLIGLFGFVLLAITAYFVSDEAMILLFGLMYCVYIYLTFKLKIIDIAFF